MDRRTFILSMNASLALSALGSAPASATNLGFPDKLGPGAPRTDLLAKAEAAKPMLLETQQLPMQIVTPRLNSSAPLRYDMVPTASATTLGSHDLNMGDSIIVDFGGHRTGYVSFRLETSRRAPDSPARLRLTFGEVPTDVAEPLHPYKGELAESWLPEDVVTVDNLPTAYAHPRRHAFRYLRIDVIGMSPKFSVRIAELQVRAVTSAQATIPALAGGDQLDKRIDEVAVATLRDCLQTVLEDGPRRDQRLWLGDLRLQALSNYATFRSNEVIKRCFYLFAGLPRRDGMVNSCVYEKPKPTYSSVTIYDYTAMFNVALAEYVEATGDTATGQDLWETARRQLELLGEQIGEDGLFLPPKEVWLFIDWLSELDRTTAIQGVLILAHEKTLDLARRLGREHEVAGYPALIKKMREAARHAWFDPAKRMFVSGPQRQLSWASQAWMVLAGVPESVTEAQTALRTALASPDALKPTTPYLYHYVVEALMHAGLRTDAHKLVRYYWGGMVNAGADTFWEVYDPAKPLSSPYGDIHINSYCHAWSCTPTWFYRTQNLLTD